MSYRIDLTERLIEIPFRLARRPHSRQELANDYAVSAKTISSDINALTRIYPIELKRAGREVFYRFADGFKFEFPKISPEELATMLLAQEAIAGIGITAKGAPYAKYADSLLEKVRASLPFSIKERMDTLSKVFGSAVVPAKNFTKHARTIDVLANCAVRRRKAHIRYHALNSNEETVRTLNPYAVYFDPDGATLKLVAFDTNHRDVRVFSVDRISNVSESKEKFTRPKDFDLKKYLDENCFNGIHGKAITVRLKAVGVTARIFAERQFHPTQKTVERKQRRGSSPETITVEMRVANGRGLIRFILGWLPDVEVVSPAEVRDEVSRILRRSFEKFD